MSPLCGSVEAGQVLLVIDAALGIAHWKKIAIMHAISLGQKLKGDFFGCLNVHDVQLGWVFGERETLLPSLQWLANHSGC